MNKNLTKSIILAMGLTAGASTVMPVIQNINNIGVVKAATGIHVDDLQGRQDGHVAFATKRLYFDDSITQQQEQLIIKIVNLINSNYPMIHIDLGTDINDLTMGDVVITNDAKSLQDMFQGLPTAAGYTNFQHGFYKMTFNPNRSSDKIEKTIMHEFGHIFGLDHSSNNGDLMFERSENSTKLAFSDENVAFLHSKYDGADDSPMSNNNTKPVDPETNTPEEKPEVDVPSTPVETPDQPEDNNTQVETPSETIKPEVNNDLQRELFGYMRVVESNNKSQVYSLEDNNKMSKVPGKRLDANTYWATDQKVTINHDTYLRVSTNEWIRLAGNTMTK